MASKAGEKNEESKTVDYFKTIEEAKAAADCYKPSYVDIEVSQFAEDADADKLDQNFFDFDNWQQDGIVLKYSGVKCPAAKGVGTFVVNLKSDIAKAAKLPTKSIGQEKSKAKPDAHKTLGQICQWARANNVVLDIEVNEVKFGWYSLFKSNKRLVVVNYLVVTVSPKVD
jgi:hypothetical protein